MIHFVVQLLAIWKWIHQEFHCWTQSNDWNSLYELSFTHIEYVKSQFGQAIGSCIAWLDHISAPYHFIHWTYVPLQLYHVPFLEFQLQSSRFWLLNE